MAFFAWRLFRKVKSLSLKMKKKIIMIIACASRNYLLVCAELDDCWQRNCNFSYFQQYLFWFFLYSHLFSTVALVIDLVVCFSRLVTIFPPSHHLRYSKQALSLSAPTLPSVLFVLLKLFSSWSLCAFGGIFVALFIKIGVKILRRRTWTGISIDHGSPVIYINTITIIYIRDVNPLHER